MSPPTKEQRILAWIGEKSIGTRFYAHEIAKDLDLTSARSAGKILFLTPERVKNVGRCNGNTHVWEIVA
jgi:hypothetical protein